MIHINAPIAVEDETSVVAFVSVTLIQAVLHMFEFDFLDFYATNRIATIEALGPYLQEVSFI